MTKIVPATVLKRTLVALADFALFAFLALGIFAAGQNIANSSPLGTTLRENISSYQIDSGLYYLDENGNAVAYTNLATFELYQEKLLHFYTVYMREECPAEYRQNYDVYWYNVHVLGLQDTKGKYPNDTILEPAKSLGKTYFQYDGDNVDALGVVGDFAFPDKDRSKPMTPDAKGKLLNYYYSPSSQNAYYNAGRDLYFSTFYQKDLGQYQNITNVIPVTVGVFLSGLIFYLVLPLIFKNGATLCKKGFGLCLLSVGGYKVKRGQVLLRQAPTILAATALFFFVPFRYAVMIASLALLLSYILSIATKSHQALHDLLAYTTVIDAKESFFYANPAEEEAAQASFDAAMEEAERLKAEGEETLKKEAKEKALK